MKQVIVSRGGIEVADLPAPPIERGAVLVAVEASLISAGTEMAAAGGGGGLAAKIETALEKANKSIEHVRQFGLRRTYLKIQEKLGEIAPLGYSCAGRVIGVGEGVAGFRPGHRVACAGAGQANHAEIVSVPKNLVVPVPEGLEAREACSVTLGAIAMQGVRRADVRLGEVVVVIGLGLLGQLTAQLLKAAGVGVLGIDLSAARVKKALEIGADWAFAPGEVDPEEFLRELTHGHGADATIITAATRSNEPVRQAMQLTRKKGRVVLVGDVGLQLERSPFYEKEIDFLISCSYGPGRYDSKYEQDGLDYPYPYVRWTERRNMDLYLRMIAARQIRFADLIEAEYPVERATEAYAALSSEEKRPLAVILNYPEMQRAVEQPPASNVEPRAPRKPFRRPLGVALIGAGEFTRIVHLPNLKAAAGMFDLRWCVTQYGTEAEQIARQHGIPKTSTRIEEALADPNVDLVMVLTRHNTHAKMAEAAARAGKAVFCEKPMALDPGELESLERALRETGVPYVVDFNRRMAPSAQELKRRIADRTTPLVMQFRVNAGYLPPDHWTQTAEGGGRLIGEACHMIDFFVFLSGSRIAEATVEGIDFAPTSPRRPTDNFSALFRLENGDVATLTYCSVGPPAMGKERVEVLWNDRGAVIDDFRVLRCFGPDGLEELCKSAEPDKGHRPMLVSFAESLLNGTPPPISLEEIVHITDVSLRLDRAVRDGGQPSVSR